MTGFFDMRAKLRIMRLTLGLSKFCANLLAAQKITTNWPTNKYLPQARFLAKGLIKGSIARIYDKDRQYTQEESITIYQLDNSSQ